jgi:hypothetical protein
LLHWKTLSGLLDWDCWLSEPLLPIRRLLSVFPFPLQPSRASWSPLRPLPSNSTNGDRNFDAGTMTRKDTACAATSVRTTMVPIRSFWKMSSCHRCCRPTIIDRHLQWWGPPEQPALPLGHYPLVRHLIFAGHLLVCPHLVKKEKLKLFNVDDIPFIDLFLLLFF